MPTASFLQNRPHCHSAPLVISYDLGATLLPCCSQALLSLIGDGLMLHLLLHTAIFVPLMGRYPFCGDTPCVSCPGQ